MFTLKIAQYSWEAHTAIKLLISLGGKNVNKHNPDGAYLKKKLILNKISSSYRILVDISPPSKQPVIIKLNSS